MFGVAWLTWGHLAYLVVGSGLILLALWLAALDITDRVIRTFAALLLFQGLHAIVFVTDASVTDYLGRVRVYFELAIPFIALWFFVLYRTRYATPPLDGAPKGPARWAWLSVLGGAVVAELLFAFDHGLYWHDDGLPGPLSVAQSAGYLVMAVTAFVLLRDFRRSGSNVARVDLFLVGIGLLLPWTYISSNFLAQDFAGLFVHDPGLGTVYSNGYFLFDRFVWVAVLSIAALIGFQLAADWKRAGANPSLMRNGLIGILAAFLIGIVAGVPFEVTYVLAPRGADGHILPHAPVWIFLGIMRAFYMAFSFVLPLLAIVALLRHRLFGLEYRVKIAIERSTIGGAFIAMFFIVSEGAQTLLQNLAAGDQFPAWAASLVGLLGAGLLVFAIHPLQRMAEHFSNGAAPHAKSLDTMDADERLRLYREQAEVAWLDGQMERKERLLLDQLRTRLGLTAEQAARAESEAVRSYAKTATRTAARGRSKAAPRP